MQVTITVDFEFSGCNYHAPSALDFETCEEVLREEGRPPALDYQVWAYRDLLLKFAQQIAHQWPDLESAIREDVEKRLGYKDGVAPIPAGAGGSREG
ncbi:MAG: hypothetical protein ACF8R7_12160 [Phycisphaerales bacterium JB039]